MGTKTAFVLAETLAGAGLRVGEAIALRWKHVNLASGTIRVADAKTAAGVRVVELPDGLASALRRYKAHGRKTGPNDPVFRMDRSGDPQTIRNAQQRMKPAIRKAKKQLVKLGIEPISESVSPHALRRSYSSIRFALRDDPVWVSEQMGHRQVQFSMSVYAQAVSRRAKLTGNHAAEFDRAIDWAQMGTTGVLVPEVEPAISVPEPVTE
jgi:integrase